jgi:hypothetical protein
MQPARAATAAGQRDVQRLGLQLGLQLFRSQRVAPGLQQRLDQLFGLIDRASSSRRR